MWLCGNQHHLVDDFTFESISLKILPSKGSDQECSLAEDLDCDQITPAWYWRLGDNSIISCEDRETTWCLPAPSYLLP